MYRTLLLLSILIVPYCLQAQESDSIVEPKPWRITALPSLTLTQVSLTNWAGGGQSSFSILAALSGNANYIKNKFRWQNSWDLAYGQLQQGTTLPIKTDDRIELTSQASYQASKSWKYSLLTGFRTQFIEGYNPPEIQNDSTKISDFLAPGYVSASLGMEYGKTEKFTALISPISFKGTIVNDEDLANAGAFGVEAATFDTLGNVVAEGKRFRAELGAAFNARYQDEIAKNVALRTTLGLFSNLIETPQNIDVNWEVGFNFKVNEWMSATLATVLIYDDDIDIITDKDGDGVSSSIGPAIQFKQVFGLNISLGLKNKGAKEADNKKK